MWLYKQTMDHQELTFQFSTFRKIERRVLEMDHIIDPILGLL